MGNPATPIQSRFGADFAPRVASGAALIALAGLVTYLGGPLFILFWLVAFGAVAWEWQRMIDGGASRSRWRTWVCWAALAVAAALAFLGQAQWSLAAVALAALVCAFLGSEGSGRLLGAGGAFYAGLPLIAVLALRGESAEGRIAMFWLYAIVWTTDIAGYFFGRLIGGPKLWPSISPGKTWSGAFGGTICAAAAGLLFSGASDDIFVFGSLGLGASIAAQAGDLFESALKRRFGVKDSSALIPGHGGVMDRLDGFVAAAVLACIVAWVNGEGGAFGAGLFAW